MKTVKMFVLSALLTTGAFLSAGASNILSPKPTVQEELRSTILSYLSNSERLLTEEARTATIKFLVNRENELVVINVATEYNDIDQFVKDHLNYKTIKVEGVKPMSTYAVKVTFQDKFAKIAMNREVQDLNPLYDLSLSYFSVELLKDNLVCFNDVKAIPCHVN